MDLSKNGKYVSMEQWRKGPFTLWIIEMFHSNPYEKTITDPTQGAMALILSSPVILGQFHLTSGGLW